MLPVSYARHRFPAKIIQPMNLAALVVLGLIGGAVGTVLLLFFIGYLN